LRIPRAEAGGWSITWPMKAFRSVVTEYVTSCAAWAYEQFIRNLAPRFRVIQPGVFRAWLTLIRLRISIRSRRLISPTSHYEKVFSIWSQLLISFPGTSLPGNYPTALTQNSLWMPLEMAFAGGRKPEIFHSDQGSQFTSSDFVERLQADKIKISWSGRRRCFDKIIVERLWRTVKYEEVYL
jgi:hypothetical protein